MSFARSLLTFLACIVASPNVDAKEPLGRLEFTQYVVQQLRNSAPDLTVTVVRDLQLRVVGTDGRETTAFLDNAYKASTRDPDHVADIAADFVAATREQIRPQGPALRREQIVPIIKDRAWKGDILQPTRERTGKANIVLPASEEYNSELLVLYAEDSPGSVRYLLESDLRSLTMSRADLRSLAVHNLVALLTNIEVLGQGGLYMATAGGNYEASLLLVDSFWISEQQKVDGDIVVAIPARDLLVFCGSRDAAAVARLREFAARKAGESSYPITPSLFVRRNGRFEPLERSQRH